MGEPLVTARYFAERIGVTPETVLRWTRRGLVPAIKLPSGAVRYRPETIDVWLTEHTIGADDATRGVSPAPNVNRPGQAYDGRRYFDASPVPLRDAAQDEEDSHAR
jgi:Helix-turn-helix domain